MADIRLAKPAAGAAETVTCEPSARFVFDFPATDATLARDGDDLTISFEDGSKLRLQDFYQEYTEENLPSFSVDGTDVTAQDFFQAMNEPDLMPAAGPGTGTVANGARFHEWGGSDLAGGIEHLNGLDWGFSRAFEWEDHPNAVGYNDDDEGGTDRASLLFGTPTITNPRVPADEPKNPGDPDTPPSGNEDPGSPAFVPSTGEAHVVVDEAGLGEVRANGTIQQHKGSGLHTEHGVSGTNSFTVDIPASEGGVIELSAGGTTLTATVRADGSLVDFDGGQFSVNGVTLSHFHVSPAGAGKWTVTYDYVLTSSQRHDDPASGEQGFVEDADYTTNTVKFDNAAVNIRVTDGTGDVATSQINVEVHDDIPHFDQTDRTDATEYTSGKFAFDFMSQELGHEFFTKIMNQNDKGYINYDTIAGHEDGAASHLQGDKMHVDFNMTASFMYYQYKDTDASGGKLEVENVIDISSLIANSGKALEMTGDGVAMGSGRQDAWNSSNGEFSTGNQYDRDALEGQWSSKTLAQQNMLRELYGDDSILNKDICAANVAEGIVFDLNDIAYGMELNLGSFAQGDRVLVSFVMTAPYNDDNHVYKTVEINYDDLKTTEDGKFLPGTYGEIEVLEDGLHLRIVAPDGFTKAFVSALGSGDYVVEGNGSNAILVGADEQSGFTIRDVAFITPQWKSSGQVHASSADGIESYTLDTDAFPGTVYVKGMYAGDFELTISKTFENGVYVYTGTIQGERVNGDANPYDGELFTFTIDRDGNWEYTQAKEFSLSADALDAVPAFTIVATDGDGDTASYDLALNGEFAHYHEVLFGQNDDSTDPTKDANDDTVIGHDGNSLIYGKGGDDLLAGDKIDEETANDLRSGIPDASDPAQLGAFAAGLEEHEGKDAQGVHFGGEDLIYGGVGDDILLGMGGDDRLYGEKGDDHLFGGSGNDYLDGGTGKDVLAGGSGDDILVGANHAEANDNAPLNIAFLVDVSGDNPVAAYQAQLAQLFDQLQADLDAGRDVNIMLMGFHSYATQAVTVNLARDDNPWEALDAALKDIAGKDLVQGNYEWNFYNSAAQGSNHELAYNYANGWFDQLNNGAVNKVFMLSNADPSAHVFSNLGHEELGVGGNYGSIYTDQIQLPGYEFGKRYSITNSAGETLFIINEAGLVEQYHQRDFKVGNDLWFTRSPGDPIGLSTTRQNAANPDGKLHYDETGKNEYHLIHYTPLKDGSKLRDFDDGNEPALIVYKDENRGWILASVAGFIGDPAIEKEHYSAHTDTALEKLESNADLGYVHAVPDYAGDSADAMGTVQMVESILPGHEGDTLLGGDGNDILFGDSVPDTLAGMDPKDISAAVKADPQKYAGNVDGDRAENDYLDGGEGDDILYGGAGNDELHGGEGDDMLFGGSGDDKLFGDAGNDYLDGGTGIDTLYGGAGNDLIVYDANDYLIDGGDGIDFLLSGQDETLHLGELLESPKVNDVEVLLKGADALSLTNMDDLAQLGITVGDDGTVTLDGWTKADGNPATATVDGKDVTVTTWEKGDLTLETTLQGEADEAGKAVLAAQVGAETGM